MDVILATNFNSQVVESGTTEPIKSENDIPTDHLTIFARFKMKRVPDYKVETYSYYHETEAGNLRFGDWLKDQDWSEVRQSVSVDQKVEALHSFLKCATDYAYEWKT